MLEVLVERGLKFATANAILDEGCSHKVACVLLLQTLFHDATSL